MKKHFFATLVFICITILFTSCATALKTIPTVPQSSFRSDEKIMEFIGFNNNEMTTVSVGATYSNGLFGSVSVTEKLDLDVNHIGARLEYLNIAVDHQHQYMGIYSFAELELYKSSTRYVTFIKALKQDFSYRNYERFMFSPVGKFNKTTVTYIGEYRIYIYDTQKKEVVYTAPMNINRNDTYKGCYTKSSLDEKAKFVTYYSTLFSNMLIENYEKAYKYLLSRPD